MLPNFVIAGVNKAGTTSLFSYLSYHPDVCHSSVKETCYFLPILYQEAMDELAAYQKLFSRYRSEKIVMEATPGYFYGGIELASRMHEVLGDAKVLIILREPVERLISFYRFMKTSLLIPADMPLKMYVDTCMVQTSEMFRKRENNPYFGLEGGCYSRYLPAWQEVFGDELKIVFFDELRKDPEILLRQIARFLDIDESYFGSLQFDVENKTLGYKNRLFHATALQLNRTFETALRRSPRIKKVLREIYYQVNGSDTKEQFDAETIALLYTYYRPFNTQLCSMLSINESICMPEWLSSCTALLSETHGHK